MANVYGQQRASLKARATVFFVALLMTVVVVGATFPAREKPALWLVIIPIAVAAGGFWLGLYYMWRMRVQLTPDTIHMTVPFRGARTIHRRDIALITAVPNDDYPYYRLTLKDGSDVNLSPALFELDPSWDSYLRTFARAEG